MSTNTTTTPPHPAPSPSTDPSARAASLSTDAPADPAASSSVTASHRPAAGPPASALSRPAIPANPIPPPARTPITDPAWPADPAPPRTSVSTRGRTADDERASLSSSAQVPPVAGTDGWVLVCDYTQLLPERGVCALLGGQQVAIFRDFSGRVYAVGNRDPYSAAYVMSRGIVGSRGGEPTVASPMHKQVYSLVTGECLDDPALAVPTFAVRVNGGHVEVAALAMETA